MTAQHTRTVIETDFQSRAYDKLRAVGVHVLPHEIPDIRYITRPTIWRLTISITRPDGAHDKVTIDTPVDENFPNDHFLAQLALVAPR